MKEQDLDAMLEKMLKSKEEYVQDDGFTQNVIQALPRPSILANWIRNCIIISATVLASGIALFVFGDARMIVGALYDVCVSPTKMQVPQISSIIIFALAVWGIIAALRTDMEPVS
jgi:hypothetical protein